MITLWRLTTRARREKAFDGEGAKKYGGRWNPKGTSCIYTSASTSLALLENLAHFSLDTAPNLYLYSIVIEDNLISPPPVLPNDWQDDLILSQEIGRRWCDQALSLVLPVPSSIVPSEMNYLLNPLHRKMANITIVEHGLFDVDGRLLR